MCTDTRREMQVCGGNMIETMISFLQSPIVIEAQVWEMIVVALLGFVVLVRMWLE